MTTGSDSLVVGVIDSGVNVGHPDLQANVDAANAFDFVNGNANVSDDTLNHGTLVASVIGSRGDNGIGTTGVDAAGEDPAAAGGQPRVQPEHLGDRQRRRLRPRQRRAGGEHELRPLRRRQEDQALIAAIEASPNILFSASAGNLNDSGLPNDNDVNPHWPSNITVDHANVIASANTTNTDALAPDSSYGGTSVDLAAPGTDLAGAKATQTVFAQDFDSVSVGSIAHAAGRDGDMGRHERARRLRAELAHRLPGRQLPEQQQHGGDLAGLHGAHRTPPAR